MRPAPNDDQPNGPGFFVLPVLLFLMAVVGGGCSLFGQERSYNLRLETDQSVYAADSSTTLRLTVTNTDERAAYYVCTGTIFLEALSGEKVTDSWKIHGFEECLTRAPIKPREAKNFEMNLLPPGNDSPALADLAGARYRLRMELYKSEEIDQLVARKERLSNTFDITR